MLVILMSACSILPKKGSALSDVEMPPELDGNPVFDISRYILQPSDEIDLQIFREPDFSGIFTLSQAGDIKHPLIGTVQLGGLTVSAAESNLHAILERDYLVNPRVLIKVTKTESSQIVIFGEVKKPGILPVPVGEPVTLLKAIALAGGFTELASPDRVRIVRKEPDGGTTTIKARVSGMLGGSKKDPDIKLEPGDVVVVPEIVF